MGAHVFAPSGAVPFQAGEQPLHAYLDSVVHVPTAPQAA